MSIWIAVIAAGVGSYLLRALPLLIGHRLQLSERSQAGLRHAGMGAITALLVLGVVSVVQPGSGVPLLPVVLALVVAVASAGLGRSMLTTVLAGAGTYAVAFIAAAAAQAVP